MHRDELNRYLADLLETARFRDYSPNGLQVEGRPDVRRIVTGVTASADLIDAAIAADADALVVHHGYFWRGEDPRLVGTRRARIAKLIAADLNLFAFHLPLDAHPSLGNNAQLARVLGFVAEGRTREQDVVAFGAPDRPLALEELGARVGERLARAPLVVGDPARIVRRIAWCTGGAQGYFEAAIELGVDAYLTGEISEQHVHLARESGVAFIAAGHHATERFGVQALGGHLERELGLVHRFVDLPNPV
ncbi:MAG: Nif3-like dinuclear metal center hexameric protein [Burkholderiales bacterium]|jgi:dinuclear metal center YbgI/SA1388 family protein|nr:Nif3-like dinuclear metal center hexameric protein [Burkholderiales bacterium]